VSAVASTFIKALSLPLEGETKSAISYHPRQLEILTITDGSRTISRKQIPIVQAAQKVDALKIIAEYLESDHHAVALALQGFLPLRSTEELLLHFQHLCPKCPIYSVDSLGEPMKRTNGGIFELDSTKIAKFSGHDLERTIKQARVLSALPPHKNLNRFEGIVLTKLDGCALVFQRIDGNSLEPSEPSRTKGRPYLITSFKQKLKIVIEMVEVFVHLEKNGIAYDDVRRRNVMVSTEGETSVIDYDGPCAYVVSEQRRVEERKRFGRFLQGFDDNKEFQALGKECQSDRPLTGKNALGWAEILQRLKKIPSQEGCIIA
jgi:serine/threonine protein kinase